ncbi:MAG: hypothetical protein WBA01_07090, partial [Phormidesmis sp.]
FGADLFPSDVRWAKSPVKSMFPVALELDSLEQSHFKLLRTWFVTHSNWPDSPKRQQATRKKNQQKRKAKQDNGQLSLLG